MGWIDITPELTDEGIDRLAVGQVLLFKNKTRFGTQLKIMRIYKGKVWAKVVFLYEPDEIEVADPNEALGKEY